MTKINSQSVEKFGGNNMRGERIKNVGIPKLPTDGMTWGAPKYTTTLRDLLNVSGGEIIFNTTTNKINYYNGSTWVEV